MIVDIEAPIIQSREIHSSVSNFNQKDWSKVVNGQNIYLSYEYLISVESTMNDEMDFYYSISYNSEKEPVLVSVFQLVNFKNKSKNCPSAFFHEDGTRISLNLLVCGNVFSDGENGFIKSESISSEEAINELNSIVKQIKLDENLNKKISITLFKEFFPNSVNQSDHLKSLKYRDFMVDVNMILKIHNDWTSMDAYLDSMKTKYRTRAKGVYKKSKSLDLKSLNSNEIIDCKESIDKLFNNVLEKSDSTYGTMKAETFAKLKSNLGDDFCLYGLFLGEEMMGFSTSFYNQGKLEANYVGINYDSNHELNIYQRLLYGYVEQAIERKAQELHLGRTSELIKSSLGATPVNMKLYAKHRNAISNVLLKPIFSFISPSKFELRQPFKADFKY